jgi:outer membrane protein OmpA-like peptidoglycan-associated protein
MKTHNFHLLTILVLLLATKPVFSEADKNEIFAIQPKVGLNYDFYLANFNGFKGSVDCGLFDKGFGWGIPLGLSIEKYISDKTAIELLLMYNSGKGYFTQQISFPMRDLNNGNIVNVNTENQLKLNLSIFELNPNISYDIYSNEDYFTKFVGGLNFLIPLTKTFEQKEVLTSPSSAVFVNSNGSHTKERALANGAITTITSPIVSPTISLEAISRTYGTFRLSFSYSLNNYTTDVNWKSLSLRFLYGYRFSIHKSEPKPIKIIEVPLEPVPVKIETPPEPVIVIDNVKVEGKIEIGNELLASLPIVNSVFFDNQSAQIPQNYLLKELPKSNFSGDAVQIHNYLLTRIVDIINKNHKATITLQASTSGEANEPKGLELAKQRANAVKQYLINLGIPANKINEEYSILPKNPSNQDFKEGVAENQRVDIVLSNAPLQEYVDLQKYANFTGRILFDAKLQNTQGKPIIAYSNLSQNKLNIEKSGTYELPLNYRLDSNKLEDKVILTYSFKGDNKTIEKVINYADFPKEQVDLNLDNFLAILRFDYNSSKISEENKELLRQLANKLPENSTIQILGSTDELGTQQRNAILAQERAENTKNFIQSIVGNKLKIEIGTNNDKFPENTPQGRFLNRSIKIRVKK